MNTSKLDLIQSISEQQQKADQLQQSLERLSKTLNNFELFIDKNEEPIINSTSLLQEVQETTNSLKSHLHSILIEIGNLSPQAIKTLSASYMEQIEEHKLKYESCLETFEKIKRLINQSYEPYVKSYTQNIVEPKLKQEPKNGFDFNF